MEVWIWLLNPWEMVFGGLDLASQPLGNGFWRSGFGFPTLGKCFLEVCEAFPYVFLLIIFFITDIFLIFIWIIGK